MVNHTAAFRRLWPKSTATYIFLGEAIDVVGRALHGGAWTGEEAVDCERLMKVGRSLLGGNSRKLPPPPPQTVRATTLANAAPSSSFSPAPVAGRADEKAPKSALADIMAGKWDNAENERAEETERSLLALGRLNATMDWIAEQGIEPGRLDTFGCRPEGGPHFPLPPHIWNVGTLGLWSARFARCRAPYAGGEAMLFLTRASLDRYLSAYRPKETTTRRPRAKSLEGKDEALLVRMRAMIDAGKATGAFQASVLVAGDAAGDGTPESIAKRLERRYVKKYGEE